MSSSKPGIFHSFFVNVTYENEMKGITTNTTTTSSSNSGSSTTTSTSTTATPYQKPVGFINCVLENFGQRHNQPPHIAAMRDLNVWMPQSM